MSQLDGLGNPIGREDCRHRRCRNVQCRRGCRKSSGARRIPGPCLAVFFSPTHNLDAVRSDRLREFNALLEFVKQSRGFDFTGYKRASLTRRVHRRMQVVGVNDLRGVRDVSRAEPGRVRSALQHHPDQRDRVLPRWRAVGRAEDRDDPALLEASGPTSPSASGARAAPRARRRTPLAIVLAEALGHGRVRRARQDLRDRRRRRGAGRAARHGGTMRRHESPRCRRSSCSTNTSSSDDDALRASARTCAALVIFGRNDLVQDAPISRIDLLVCRNTLMYFNADEAVADPGALPFRARPTTGYLLLGTAETLMTPTELFAPVDLASRSSRRSSRGRSAIAQPLWCLAAPRRSHGRRAQAPDDAARRVL